MAEILMQGNVGYVPEYIFRRRDHPDCYVRAMSTAKARQAWFDSDSKHVMPAQLVKMKYYFESISRSRMNSAEKLTCVRMLASWALKRAFQDITGTSAMARNNKVASSGDPSLSVIESDVQKLN